MRFPAIVDRPVAAALRALPSVAASSGARPRELFARAELHGVSGLLWDAWKAEGASIEPELAMKLEASAIARALDHDAHVGLLHRIDEVLAVPAVVLKGPLFAARYYDRASARATTDIDLLVAESDLAAAESSLARASYVVADSPEEVARARREHHHLHLTRPNAPALELHFHAYRGFGVTLRTEMLADNSLPVDGFRTLRVARPEDELVYLAAHAAAHRFMRLGWLYDLRLVVERMSPDALASSASHARAWGVSRVLALTGELLVDVLGLSGEKVRPLGALPAARRSLVHAVVGEPDTPILRAATRFAYTTMLADTPAASFRYVRSSSAGHARRLLGLG